MIQKIIHKILLRRHFWRYATFSEVAELYAARLLRTLALHMVNVFIAIFLYNMGFPLVAVFLYLGVYYLVKIPLAFLASAVTAWFGPKHAALIANLLYIPSLIVFTFVTSPETMGSWIALGLVLLLQASSTVLYDYSYLVNFSKVKSVEHGGKELGYMHVLEKAANIISPIVGGVIATLFGSAAVMIVAACLFAVAALPLLRTGEPIKTKRDIRWRGFPWRATWRSIVGESGIGFDVVASGAAWSLFLAVVVFASQANEIYTTVGILIALGTVAAFIAAFVFGKIIDRKQGDVLIKFGVISKAIGHVLRPFVGGSLGAAGISAASEVSTTAYNMAYVRGVFDVADRSGFRLAYILLVEMAANIGAALACVIAAVLFSVFEPAQAFTVFFMVSACYLFVLTVPRFVLYKR